MGSITVVKSNENLAANNLQSQEINGIAVTVNEDKSFTLNGTATANFALYYNKDNIVFKGDYIFYLIGKNNKINLQGRENGVAVGYITYTMTQEHIVKNYEKRTMSTELFSYIQAGQTFNNETFKVMITKGSEVKNYTPHASQTHTIYTQEPFRAIGEYKDKFVRKAGKWYERHEIQRKILDGTENWALHSQGFYYVSLTKMLAKLTNEVLARSNYFEGIAIGTSGNSYVGKDNIVFNWRSGDIVCIKSSKFENTEEFKAFLAEKYAEGTPVYVDYILQTANDIECTEEQSAQLDALETSENYKAGTIVYSTDEISPKLNIAYRKDLETVQANDKAELQEQIDEIKALLSTTNTSAMLLDNMQTDLESEVE